MISFRKRRVPVKMRYNTDQETKYDVKIMISILQIREQKKRKKEKQKQKTRRVRKYLS